MIDDLDEETVAKAFNAGYLMQQNEPKLLQRIVNSDNQKNDYIEGMTLGKQQYQREKVIEQQQQMRTRQQEKKRGR